MHRAVLNLIAVADGAITATPTCRLAPSTTKSKATAAYGYAVARSDRLWIGGYRIHSPESILFGNYRPYVPPSNFTCQLPGLHEFPRPSIVKGTLCLTRSSSLHSVKVKPSFARDVVPPNSQGMATVSDAKPPWGLTIPTANAKIAPFRTRFPI